LARAHARAGDAVSLTAYIGDDTDFDKAISHFAVSYAEQTARDWHTLLAAIEESKISAV
jgi:hypothetical protein